MAATYPADTFQEGVDLTIEASNQLAQVVRGDANTEVTVADGSTIPSIRKAQADSMYFKEPELWTTGQTETDYLQLKKYTDPVTNKESWWFAKGALASNPIAMGTSPFGDDNWTLYTPEDLFISGKAEYESIYQALKGKAAEAGYNLVVGSFEEGGTLTNTDGALWYQADGKYYSWAGTLPKVVSSGSTPATSGGIGAGAWVDRSDVTLRSDLASESGSGLVGYQPAGTGAVATTVQSKLRESVSVKDFGAVGDGVTDDTTAIAAAVAAVLTGGIVLFPPATYLVSTVNVTGKSVVLSGYGSTINSTSANGGIYKTDHGNKLIVEGLSFTGTGAGIKQNAPVQSSSQDELDIIGCSFNMNSGVYGIYIVGGRNPRIQNCFFRNERSGSGVYLKDTVSPFLSTCTFKGGGYVGRGVYYPGTGNGTDAGLIIRDCEIMGWDKGVEVVGCDWLVIEGSTIDYNNQSIKLGSQDRANISNNYIGSLGDTPALWLTYDAAGTAPDYCEKIFIVNNTFTGHYTGGNTYDCILLDGTNPPDSVVIANNSISFYTRAGIRFSLASQRLIVTGNTFAQRTGFGVAPIYNQTGSGDSNVVISQNYFSNTTTIAAMNVSSVCRVNTNIGCDTERRGEVVVGAGVSTFSVAHGLSYTPSKSDISLTPTNAEAALKNPYVNSVDATSINVGFTAVTTANAGVGWRVRRYI